MCWQIDAPSQRSCADNDTYQALGKITFNEVSVLTQHTSVVNGKAVGKQLTKLLVSTVRHLPQQTFNAIRYNMYLRALKRWRYGQLNLHMAQKQKNKEKLKTIKN